MPEYVANQLAPPVRIAQEDAVQKLSQVSDSEALRLVSAFLQIHEPERRRKLLELAERMARRSTKPVGALPIVSQDNEL